MKTIAKLLALAALLTAPLFAQPSGNTLPRNNPTFSGTLTGPLEVLNQPGIATTSTDALTLQNATASTSGATVQYSPRLHFVGHAWNTTATAADNYLELIEELRPASAATPTASLAWAFRRSTAGTGSFVDFGSMAPNGTGGGILLTALGTNQSITLTPSGTGGTSFVGASETSWIRAIVGSPTLGGLYLAQATPTATNYNMLSDGANFTVINAPVLASSIRFNLGDTEKARFAPTTGNLLLGGLTTDGTGVLQLPTGAGDATSGITMASGGLSMFASSGTLWRARSSASDTLQLILGGTSGDALALLYNGATSTISNGRNGPMLFQTNSTTVLTLSATAGTITGGAQSMVLASGTGNSRTMTLQTTTSGGTATNFLVADATQGITAGSLAGTGSRAVLADANGLLSAPVSDETWKEPLRDLPESYGLEAVMKLRPAIYKYLNKSRFGTQDYIGFGARATSKILPEVTGQDRDGTYYMNKEDLTAVLVKAIQQQQAEIQELRAALAGKN